MAPTHVILELHSGRRPHFIREEEDWHDTLLRVALDERGYANAPYEITDGLIKYDIRCVNDSWRSPTWVTDKFEVVDKKDFEPTAWRVCLDWTFASKHKKAKTHVPKLDYLSLKEVPWYEYGRPYCPWKTLDDKYFIELGPEAFAHLTHLGVERNLRYRYPHDHRHLDPRPASQGHWPHPSGEPDWYYRYRRGSYAA